MGIFFLARPARPAECRRVSRGPTPERLKLALLFFLTAHALGLWSINFSTVLEAYGYAHLVADAWATTALAALVSPLIAGALADQRYSTERVLRWLALGAAFWLTLLFYAIDQHWHWGWVLALAQMHSLWSVPMFGLATSLVTSRLHNRSQEFGPVRAAATVGWMLAGVLVSYVLHADDSVVAGYSAAVAWLAVIALTYTLKPIPPPGHKEHRTWKDLLGLEAWSLLKNPDHRVVFLGAALFNAPLAAFYSVTPSHLKALGVSHTTAFMSIGQIMEIVGLFSLAWLVGRYRLKWLFIAGIAVGALRYVVFAMNTPWAMAFGIFLHGICFTFFFMTAQVYLDQRIPPEMRSRAQALLSLMMSGIGSFLGYEGCGLWRQMCGGAAQTDWRTYWLGLAGVILVIMLWFAWRYQGKHRDEDMLSDG
jgi:MFS family permease